MQKIYPNDWVVDQIIKKYAKSGCYPPREENVLNIGIECNIKSVIISLSTAFNLFFIFEMQQLLWFY